MAALLGEHAIEQSSHAETRVRVDDMTFNVVRMYLTTSNFYPVASLAQRGKRTQKESAVSGLAVTSCSDFNKSSRHVRPWRP